MTDRQGRYQGAARALGAVLLAASFLLWPATIASAAEATSLQGGDPDRTALARSIDEGYRVLPTLRGLLLEPREEVPGIQTIEIADGRVAINGEPVAPTILSSWLGDQATPLLALAALPEEEARALVAGETPEASASEPDAEEVEESLQPEAPEAPTPPRARRGVEDDGRSIYLGERVIFGRSLTIDDDEVAGEVVVIGGAAHILGRVDGGVVAVGGPVIIEGRVRGDVVAVGGGVEVGPDGSITGDVVSVGSSVRARGDQIGGDIVQIGLVWPWDSDFAWSPDWGRRTSPVRAWAAREAVGNVAVILLLGLMTAFLLLVARAPVERAARVIALHPGASIASGFAMWIFQLVGIWLALLLLVLTIVGCFAVPLVPVLWLFGWLLFLPGYAAAALQTGRWLTGRFGWNLGGAYGTALVGVLAIELVKLLGNVMAIAGGPLGFLAMLVKVAGILIVLLAWTIGVGAVVMNLLNRRPPPAQAPLPPGPLPPAPAPGAPPTGPEVPSASATAPPAAPGAPPEAPAPSPAPPTEEPPAGGEHER
ncbi:MAG TPA: hypothetical protein VM617_03970 [Thermoanaerobaculia bacterium]|nr:hypothetical protein [Thermoanaerobaculia bacterium]